MVLWSEGGDECSCVLDLSGLRITNTNEEKRESPKSAATPPPYLAYYFDPHSRLDNGELCMALSPYKKSIEKENAEWKACGSKWTPPVDDENFPADGNIERDPVVELMNSEFPGTSCVELMLRVEPKLSACNAVSMLIYLRKMKEKGALPDRLSFEHILAVFMCAVGMNEDFPLKNYQYARILENKDMLEDSAFMQECMRRPVEPRDFDGSYHELSILQFKLAGMIDYKLLVSTAAYKYVLREAALRSVEGIHC